MDLLESRGVKDTNNVADTNFFKFELFVRWMIIRILSFVGSIFIKKKVILIGF